jgi:hypothetical protein
MTHAQQSQEGKTLKYPPISYHFPDFAVWRFLRRAEIDPLKDPRWPELLRRHPDASVFHTRGWLETVYRTYGCKPAVFTTSGPDSDLANGLVLCRMRSWLTGRRLVSLPFSDHCEPLVTGPLDLRRLLIGVQERAHAEGCKYVELRPTSLLSEGQPGWRTSQRFYLHRLDLRPGTTAVFRGFHRDCIQRKIRRAEREGIDITEGKDLDSLKQFYRLVLQTRRRHGLPPQPISWFNNLVNCLGESVTIRFASKGGQPIAAMLTLQYGKSLYYKYGASVASFHRLGPMPYLFWHAIKDAIDGGLEELDMGRSECDNAGLVAFKDRWSATRSDLQYWRSPANGASPAQSNSWERRLAGVACRHLPDRYLAALGAFSYAHID